VNVTEYRIQMSAATFAAADVGINSRCLQLLS